MKTHEIFLASKFLVTYDYGDGSKNLHPVRVNDQCYRGLKANGYILTREELEDFCKHINACVDRRKIWDWNRMLYKEVRKELGDTLWSAHRIRLGIGA